MLFKRAETMIMLIAFEKTPEIGTVMTLDDQSYEFVGVEPYRRDDGLATDLLVWETCCPTCGAGFTAKTPLVTNTVVRRCADHRKAGKPVKGKRGRKVRVAIVEA